MLGLVVAGSLGALIAIAMIVLRAGERRRDRRRARPPVPTVEPIAPVTVQCGTPVHPAR